MSNQPEYWWCRNGMVDDESGDGMLRLKTIPPESFIPTADHDRDIKALKMFIDRCTQIMSFSQFHGVGGKETMTAWVHERAALLEEWMKRPAAALKEARDHG